MINASPTVPEEWKTVEDNEQLTMQFQAITR